MSNYKSVSIFLQSGRGAGTIYSTGGISSTCASKMSNQIRKFPDCVTTNILDCQELNIMGDLKWNSVGLNNTEILSSPEQPWTGATYTIPYCMQRQLRALKQPFGSVTKFSLHVLFWCAHAERPYVTLG